MASADKNVDCEMEKNRNNREEVVIHSLLKAVKLAGKKDLGYKVTINKMKITKER